jgi:hypothetical protein
MARTWVLNLRPLGRNSRESRSKGKLMLMAIVLVLSVLCAVRLYRKIKTMVAPGVAMVEAEVSAMKAGVDEVLEDLQKVQVTVTRAWMRDRIAGMRTWVACRIAPHLCEEFGSK